MCRGIAKVLQVYLLQRIVITLSGEPSTKHVWVEAFGSEENSYELPSDVGVALFKWGKSSGCKYHRFAILEKVSTKTMLGSIHLDDDLSYGHHTTAVLCYYRLVICCGQRLSGRLHSTGS